MPEEEDLTKPRAAWECSSWKSFQSKHFSAGFGKKQPPVLVRDGLFWGCCVKFRLRVDKRSEQEWAGTKDDTEGHKESEKLYPCLWKNSLQMSLCLFSACCILCVWNSSKENMFALLLKKNTCFSECSQHAPPLGSSSRSCRILCAVTAQVFESLLAQCSPPYPHTHTLAFYCL